MLWLSGGFIDKVSPGPPAERPAHPQVATQKVERRVYPVLMEQVGNLRAMVEAHVSSRIMSQVREILVREGDSVAGGETGTLMARLDDRDIRAKVREAGSQVTAMEKAMDAAKPSWVRRHPRCGGSGRCAKGVGRLQTVPGPSCASGRHRAAIGPCPGTERDDPGQADGRQRRRPGGQKRHQGDRGPDRTGTGRRGGSGGDAQLHGNSRPL